AVQHVVEVENPRGRHVHDIALEYFDADHAHQHDNQPRRGLAEPGADFVDGVQETLDGHMRSLIAETPSFRGVANGSAQSAVRWRRTRNPELILCVWIPGPRRRGGSRNDERVLCTAMRRQI